MPTVHTERDFHDQRGCSSIPWLGHYQPATVAGRAGRIGDRAEQRIIAFGLYGNVGTSPVEAVPRPPSLLASDPRRPTTCRSGRIAAMVEAFRDEVRRQRHRSTPSRTTTSRTTSTPTCRGARTTPSPGSPATGCATTRPRASCAPLDDVWEKHRRATSATRIAKASTGRRRQEVLRPELQLPVGVLLPQERVAGEGLRGADHLRRAQDALRRR